MFAAYQTGIIQFVPISNILMNNTQEINTKICNCCNKERLINYFYKNGTNNRCNKMLFN